MDTKKREFIDPNELMHYINENHSYAGLPMAAHICTMELLTYAPRVDAIPVDEIKFLYCKIDKNGIPELKIQLGDSIHCLRRENDPLDIREVVHGQWIPVKNKKYGYYMGLLCSECGHKERNKGGNYCPNCGADMRERKDNG